MSLHDYFKVVGLTLMMSEVVIGGGSQLPVEPDTPEFQPPCRIGNVSNSGAIGVRGLAASKSHWGVLYTTNFHGDSQTDNVIYAIDAMTGRTLGSMAVNITSFDHWIALAVGPCSASRTSYCIYILGKDSILKIAEPQQPREDSTVEVDETVVIEDHGQRSLFVDIDGTLYYLNYEDYGFQITLYRVDLSGATPTVSTVTSTYIPSASPGPLSADLSPDGTELLILMPDNVYHYEIVNRNFWSSLQGEATILPMSPFQWDFKLTWSPTGKGYYLMTGDSYSGEITLYYSARCSDVEEEKPRFSAGRSVAVIGNDRPGRMSGLAASRTHPGHLYLVSEGNPAVTILDDTTGQSLASLTTPITMATWKDVAVAKCQTRTDNCIYIIDDRKRTVYVIPEPAIISNTAVEPEAIAFTASGMFFANSIMVSPNGIIFLLEWELQNYITGVDVYKLRNNGAWVAEVVATFFPKSAREGPEAADISPDGTEVLVKMRDRILYYNVTGGDYAAAFSTEAEYLRYLPERRGNSIAWSLDASAYFTADSETGTLKKYDRL